LSKVSTEHGNVPSTVVWTLFQEIQNEVTYHRDLVEQSDIFSHSIAVKSKVQTHLERIVLRNRVSLCVLCVVMREKEDVLVYALHGWIVADNLVVLELRI
jgi:hypothetical protein